MNRKGFTLIELLATIVVLALVISISTYSVITIIKHAREKNYKLLIENIKDASELYYQECKYANNTGIACSSDGTVTLGDLVKYGYLKGNGTNESDKYTIVNPLNNKDISNCMISITYVDGKIVVTSLSSDASCSFEYQEDINTGNPESSTNLPASSSSLFFPSHSMQVIEDDDRPIGAEPVEPGDPVIPVRPGETTK